MKAAKFFAAFMGVIFSAFTLIGICCALYTGDPIWEPIVFGATGWVILTLATTAGNALIEWAYRWSQP